MLHSRVYRTFTYREAVLRISCSHFDVVASEIVRQRHILEEYIRRHPEFQHSLVPISTHPDAPEIARHMAWAAAQVGVGPMAAVAGAMAQWAAKAALAAGAQEAIIDNGGDVYLKAVEPVIIQLGTGTSKLADRLAFQVEPQDTPLSICSSSSKMGHSMSLGRCDLATVVAKDAALADAAATQAADLVVTPADIDATLERLMKIRDILGVLLVKDDRIGLIGKLPRLIKTAE
ncbi:MAG: UPF0280 family protein [Solirubrobacterales bacterium]